MNENELFLRSLVILVIRFSMRGAADDFSVDDPSCATMVPLLHKHKFVESDNTTYTLRVFDMDGAETFEYDPTGTKLLQVQIEGGPYQRVHVQARSMIYSVEQTGHFVQPLPKYFKLVNCGGTYGSAVINDNYVSRRHSRLKWMPPTSDKGPVVFMATIIQSGHIYHIRSYFISPANQLVTVDNHGCGRLYSCFKVGSENCAFGSDCRYSLKWRCFKDWLLIEAVRHGTPASFGITTAPNRAAICTSLGNRAALKEYYLTPTHKAFPLRVRESKTKCLKAVRKGSITYCRFQVPRPSVNQTNFIHGLLTEDGYPYKLKKRKVVGSNMCNALVIHSVMQSSKTSQTKSSGVPSMFSHSPQMPYAHCFIIFIIVWSAIPMQ